MIFVRLQLLAAVLALPDTCVLVHMFIEPGEAVEGTTTHRTVVLRIEFVFVAEHTAIFFRHQLAFLLLADIAGFPR